MTDDPIPRFTLTLRALSEWFSATQTPYLLIGGIAVSLIGRARTTRDVDAVVLIDEDKLESFVESGAPFGFLPRIENPLEAARSARVLLLAHRPAGNKVDILMAALPFEQESIAHGVTLHVGGAELRVPRIEDLIIMKAVAGRSIDLADIDTLLNMKPQVDRRRIRRWVRIFADAMETPEIVENVNRLLAMKRLPHSPKKKRRRKK